MMLMAFIVAVLFSVLEEVAPKPLQTTSLMTRLHRETP
jgi:hypothetical protein